MKVLVDSSVWVAYFQGTRDLPEVDWLIEEDLVVSNDLILAELLPPLLVRGESRLADLLRAIDRIPLAVDWDGIIRMQVTYLHHGINKVGLADLIMAQHAEQNDLWLFSLDQHFGLLSKHVSLKLHP